MKYSPKQYAQTLLEVIENTAPKNTDKVLDNFVVLLAENGDLSKFEDISAEFHKAQLAKKGIKESVLTSAKPLSRNAQKSILDKLNGIVGGKVELKKEIDESLIGGVLIQMDDQVIDLSTKRTLEDLKKELIN